MEYILNEILETIQFALLLYIVFKEKLHVTQLKMIGVVVLYIITFAIFLIIGQRENLLISGTIIQIIAVGLFLKEKWYEKILSFLLLFSLPSIVTISIETLGRYIIGERNLIGFMTFSYGLMGRMVGIIVFAVIGYFRYKRKETFYSSNFSKMMIAVTSSTFMTVMASLTSEKNYVNALTALLMSICSLFVVILCVWVLIIDSSRRIQHSKTEMVNKYIGYIKKLEKTQIEVRKISHDMKHHINTIQLFAEKDKVDKIKEYVESMKVDLSQRYEDVRYTDNMLFNAILTDKQGIASNKAISIKFEGVLGENIGISDYDLCIILSNLLDNAIEYTEKNQIEIINASAFQDDNCIIIKVSNEILPDKVVNTNTSSKVNKELHGYGLRNIRDAIEKNNGNLRVLVTEDTFTAEAIIFR